MCPAMQKKKNQVFPGCSGKPGFWLVETLETKQSTLNQEKKAGNLEMDHTEIDQETSNCGLSSRRFLYAVGLLPFWALFLSAGVVSGYVAQPGSVSAQTRGTARRTSPAALGL